ncbi:2-aminoethylphosphonate ABC transporter substrate-binding protein [Streptomyces sp. H10-C2]|uniref:2-aminoethylphosphonate ABC transporter substrate-binding protein n=1 Tax=unclassified Streptomyces TaxID=2593676 RepID=UPI0024B8CA79|nr:MULTISPECIES: 2-aminoethylphosphonate ABC transporter substrate-binding protein [unclassified Streptomyces]MDJ0339968.1 2-aminoethylphosphonate ABC transporter substrate-binding protein [Streptomyces sp. PH10-H1]MDJ0369395.1 2-aminoethylphosphonate ABC transporter substrate-binding protein [Streptomyces sp. H10-C2]
MPANSLKPLAAVAGALVLAGSLTACGGSSPASDAKEITVYSADGLKADDGSGFYDKVFNDFTAKTGIKVKYVEGGSGEMVQRLAREKSNTQADVVVTLPPFIQQADSKGLLDMYKPAGSDKVAATDKDAAGKWTSVVNNYFCFIHNTKELKQAPKTWDDLLDAKYKGKLQYSTPGVAGDGTAVVIKAIHDFGGLEPAMAYLKKLQSNNVGPSKSTGALAPKVDKGELVVANGDVQMNYANMKSMPNQSIFFPAANSTGKPTSFALPYAAGLVKDAPHSENGKKLLDFLLTPEVQQEVSSVGGGFPSRGDVTATDPNAAKLKEIMAGVEIFAPDWTKVNSDLASYVDAWKAATGS